MKTDRESQLNEELRSRLNALVDLAKLLEKENGSDEDVQHILGAARGLLDLIDKEAAESHRGPGGSTSKERCDVLYIEDNPISFAAVKLLLKTKRRFTVVEAANGQQGIDLAQTRHPKLILLDLDLPDIHGSEVIGRLQENPATAHIPVVVISADATPSQIERLLILGARNYLTKPFETAEFLAVVDGIITESAG